MVLQIGFMMPLDTTITMQYRHGQSTVAAARYLFRHGGYVRFYSGVSMALVQGPMSRFGDTATNAALLHWFDSSDKTCTLPTVVKTSTASALAACWRVVLMPIDVCKTVYQVYGDGALQQLLVRRRTSGMRGFYFGSAAAFTTSFAGHLPWYTTFNELDRRLPPALQTQEKLARHAIIGFTSSVVSDTITNALRVIKAIRQTTGKTYSDAVSSVLQKDGFKGLLTRGLKTRIFANGLQSVVFTILWKTIEEQLANGSILL